VHKVKLLLQAFVMLVAACVLVGCAGQQEEKEQAAKEEGEVKEKTPPEEAKPKENENMNLGVGDTAEIGGVYVTLDSATLVPRDPNLDASGKAGAKGKTNPPEGKMTEDETFVALELTVNNTAQQTVTINPALNFRLTDPNGYTFSRQPSNLIYQEQQKSGRRPGIAGDLPFEPGQERSDVESYIVPKDASARFEYLPSPTSLGDKKDEIQPQGRPVARWDLGTVADLPNRY
jgi:hypothetical protein